MQPESVLQAWKSAFPNTAPAGFLCRAAVVDRWVRTHSLPASKRYPDSPEERAEVLRRYNAVALHVLGQEAVCFLFVARFGGEQRWNQDSNGPLSKLHLTHVMSHGEEDDEIQFFVMPATWRVGVFDTLLSAVADDQTGPVLFFSPTRRTAFAPYDGGADLFLATAEEAQKVRLRFEEWLSNHPDQL